MNTHRHMAVMVGLAAVLAAALAGCTTEMQGLRFAPGEAQKQSADATRRLADAAAVQGLPPESAAVQRLAQGAAAAASYTGAPKAPLDVSALLPEAVTRAWGNLRDQVRAHELRERVRNESTANLVAALGELAARLPDKPRVYTRDLLAELGAIVKAAQMAQQLAGSVPIPSDVALTPAEKELMATFNTALTAINAKAAGEATKRPTYIDALDAGAAEAQFWLDQVTPLLSGTAAGGLLAGIGTWLAGRRKALKERQANESLEASLGTVVNQVDSFKNSPVGQAPVTVGGKEITVAAALTDILRGQDSATAAIVNALRVKPAPAEGG